MTIIPLLNVFFLFTAVYAQYGTCKFYTLSIIRCSRLAFRDNR